jgi:hypothetical protein
MRERRTRRLSLGEFGALTVDQARGSTPRPPLGGAASRRGVDPPGFITRATLRTALTPTHAAASTIRSVNSTSSVLGVGSSLGA